MKLTKSKLQQIIKEELEAQIQTEKKNPVTGLSPVEEYVRRLPAWAESEFEFKTLGEIVEWTEIALKKMKKDVEFDTGHVPDMDSSSDLSKMARGATH